jgi:simple sugar transport system ATP-binding protein
MVKGVDNVVFDAIRKVKDGTFTGGSSVRAGRTGVGYIYDKNNEKLIPSDTHASSNSGRTSSPAARGPQHAVRPTRSPRPSARDIVKSFGPVQANRGRSSRSRTEDPALVGENGAGKPRSCACSPACTPQPGRCRSRGDVTGWSTADAIAAGVGMVHQHFMLVPTLTVAENVMPARKRRGARLDRLPPRAAVRKLSAETGSSSLPPRRSPKLTVGQAQRVETSTPTRREDPLRACGRLPPRGARALAGAARTEAGGSTVILITHSSTR